jgi:hypothetical protein
MRVGLWFFTAIGLTDASALLPRVKVAVPAKSASTWRPRTQDPQFFSLRVDEKCSEGEAASACPYAGYAIRLLNGSVIATPYNKWWDPKLPIMFVDDDTKCYTVSLWAISTQQVLSRLMIADRSYRSAKNLCNFTSTLSMEIYGTLQLVGCLPTRSL